MQPETEYKSLLDNIGQTFSAAKEKAYSLMSQILIEAYWNIGRQIIEYEQKGQGKADYGKKLMQNLAKDLSLRLGKGFSLSNLYLMRQFYEAYPIFQTSGKLTWSHYGEILGISDPLSRSFYEKQCVSEGWSVRQLKRQIQSGLFQRLALSKDKAGVLALAEEVQSLMKADDVVRDPYILEFLGIPENHRLSEKELETKLIDKLQEFLLELGKGFTFVGRQFRITLDNRHYRQKSPATFAARPFLHPVTLPWLPRG
ncbi:MAG: DUF1016 family protein [Haliscomenobacteraceae bacterium CHB4]|nr:DUF1016 family protein [Haliscomenobacteraceae bacterium CHB4]